MISHSIYSWFVASVHAQTQAQQGLQEAVAGTGIPRQSIESFAANLVITLLGIVGILFMLLILYGGYTWMMGSRSGKEKEINNAKTILTNATIGLMIVIAAYVLTYFIATQIINATSSDLSQPVTPSGPPFNPK